MSDRDSRATGFGFNTRRTDPRFIESLDYLYGRINYERLSRPTRQSPLKLARMKALLAEMGNPQRGQQIVHIGGTKGKGSTASMVAAMATACGYRTGLYTSPHLNSLEERFCVAGQPASPYNLIALIDHVREAAQRVMANGEGDATFFELTTAIAIEHFHRSQCEMTILEVGLGGRLDSTNVCDPRVSAITSIGLDHQSILGDTVEKIAREKAGIIKPGIPVVSGVLDPGPAHVIAEVAESVGAPLIQLGRDFDVRVSDASLESGTDVSFDLSGSSASEIPIHPRAGCRLSLAGLHQARNAAVAFAIIDCLQHLQIQTKVGWSDSACRSALSKIKLPGRIEAFPGSPTIIVDTAHNRDSIAALCRVLSERPDLNRTVVVFGTSIDKDASEMIAMLSEAFDQIVLTRYRTNPRWYPPQDLAAIALQVAGQNWEVVEDASSALKIASQRAGPDGAVIVCGSFFLAAELRPEVVASAGGMKQP